jgi:N4-gp56 family major capsid protein
MAYTGTLTTDIFVPQVVAGKIATDYGKFITVSNFADTETTLVGRPGDTVTKYQFAYIGNGSVLGEGEDDTPVKLQSSPIPKKIVKVSKQVLVTDEVVLSGEGDPWGEAATQIAMAIALKDDADAVTELASGTGTATGATLAAAIVGARKAVGERGMKKRNYVFANTADYYDMLTDHANWVPASEIAADLVIRGVVGMYMGAYIIPTDTVTAKAPYLMLEGALKKEMKRAFLAERDRDLVNYTWLLAGSEHRVMWLQSPADVVKITVG